MAARATWLSVLGCYVSGIIIEEWRGCVKCGQRRSGDRWRRSAESSQRPMVMRGRSWLAGYRSLLVDGFLPRRVGDRQHRLLAGGAAIDELEHRGNHAGDRD